MQTEINSKNIHIACEIAEQIVENHIGEGMVWQEREDGSEGFTEDAQDMFNKVYDIITTELERHNR